MNDRETSPCEGLIDYLTGESTDIQRKRFEKHLTTCSTCQEEAALWHEVWDRLADDVDLIELPEDLKDEVMSSLTDQIRMEQHRSHDGKNINSKWRFAAILMRWGIGVAMLIMMFMSGWWLRDSQVEGAGKQTEEQAPARIETLFHLAAEKSSGKFNESSKPYGVACLVRAQNEAQLVVYVFGSPQTREREAYQVWLLKDGNRTSAGTFRVDRSGIGIMTLPLSHGFPDVDAVGVTLEPDTHSTSPRGPKMFGSTEQDPSV